MTSRSIIEEFTFCLSTPSHCPPPLTHSLPLVVLLLPKNIPHMCFAAPMPEKERERVCLRLSGNSFQLLSYKLLYMPFRLYLRLSFFHLLQFNGTCSCKETSFIIYKMNILKLKLSSFQFHLNDFTFCILNMFFSMHAHNLIDMQTYVR